MEIEHLIDDALTDEDYVVTVGEEYFNNPSHALLHLFCALLDIFAVEAPDAPVDVLAECYGQYLDDTNDPELEGYRAKCVNRLFDRVGTMRSQDMTAIAIEFELYRLSKLSKHP